MACLWVAVGSDSNDFIGEESVFLWWNGASRPAYVYSWVAERI
jgi:hypothetical protein